MSSSSSSSLELLKEELLVFVADDSPMLVASEAGELVAEYRWVRGEEADAFSREDEARERIVAEVADVGIGLVLLCERIGVDLVEAMRGKVRGNAERYPVEAARGKAERP